MSNIQIFGSGVRIKWEANGEIRYILIWSNAFGADYRKTTGGHGRGNGRQLSGLGLEILINYNLFNLLISFFKILNQRKIVWIVNAVKASLCESNEWWKLWWVGWFTVREELWCPRNGLHGGLRRRLHSPFGSAPSQNEPGL